MAFLTYSDFKTLDIIGFGEPFFRFEISGSLNLSTLDYVGFGEPWISNSGTQISPLKAASGVTRSNIKKMGGVSSSDIKKVEGITN